MLFKLSISCSITYPGLLNISSFKSTVGKGAAIMVQHMGYSQKVVTISHTINTFQSQPTSPWRIIRQKQIPVCLASQPPTRRQGSIIVPLVKDEETEAYSSKDSHL